MVAIPFPISSAPGVKTSEGAGRLVNCYAEKTELGSRSVVLWRRCGGLRQRVFITGHSHLRGAIVVGSTLIVVLDSRAYSVTKSGTVYTATDLGAIAGTPPVTTAKNNAGTPNIVAVTENGARNLFTDSAPTDFADADLPQPNSVCEIDGYFIFTIADGRIFASDLNAVTVSTSSFTTEQGLTNRRGVTFRGEVFVFGDKWTGVYRDAATSPFPLERRLTIPRGIAGTFAVAGWEPGWANELIWVGEDSKVYKLNGYTPQPISSPDVERNIEAAIRAGDGDLLEASVHMDGGHAMWMLTYPGNWSWLHDHTTGNWPERQSYGRDDCRASQSVKAFDEWLVGDRTTGKLFAVDKDYYREADDPLVMELTSGCLHGFPAGLVIPEAFFDITTGVGIASGEDPVQTDPVAQISWSLDGGRSFGNPVNRAIGAQGEYGTKVRVNRIGTSKGQGIAFKVQISDPVHASVGGGDLPGVKAVAA